MASERTNRLVPFVRQRLLRILQLQVCIYIHVYTYTYIYRELDTDPIRSVCVCVCEYVDTDFNLRSRLIHPQFISAN